MAKPPVNDHPRRKMTVSSGTSVTVLPVCVCGRSIMTKCDIRHAQTRNKVYGYFHLFPTMYIQFDAKIMIPT